MQSGIIMFATTNTLNRRQVFADAAKAREAVECLYRLQTIHLFLLFGFVIMPDHCHFLLNVVAPCTISKLLGAYKSGLTFDLGIPKLWQPRFDLRLPDDAHATLRYIHSNPVKAGLCAKREEYPWSSASGKWDVTDLP
jgi:putative transposase